MSHKQINIRCDISVSCVLNVCKANGYCIVSKCSLETKKQVKHFVETGFPDVILSVPDKNHMPHTKQKKEKTNEQQYKSWRFDTKKTECFYCKSILVGSFLTCHPDHFRTKDHILPKILGGKHGNNIVWACKTCNSDKDSLLLERWLMKIKKRWPEGDKKDTVIKTVTFMIGKLSKIKNMNREQFIEKWNIGYENKEQKLEFQKEMQKDLDNLFKSEQPKDKYKPLSEMSDHDAIEMARIFAGIEGEVIIHRPANDSTLNQHDIHFVVQVYQGKDKTWKSFCTPKCITEHYPIALCQYLKYKGYEVPVYYPILSRTKIKSDF